MKSDYDRGQVQLVKLSAWISLSDKNDLTFSPNEKKWKQVVFLGPFLRYMPVQKSLVCSIASFASKKRDTIMMNFVNVVLDASILATEREETTKQKLSSSGQVFFSKTKSWKMPSGKVVTCSNFIHTADSTKKLRKINCTKFTTLNFRIILW